jgi:hypothetical protein
LSVEQIRAFLEATDEVGFEDGNGRRYTAE